MSSDEFHISTPHLSVFSSSTLFHQTNNNELFRNKTANLFSLFNAIFPVSVICVFLLSFPLLCLAAPFHATGANHVIHAHLTKESTRLSVTNRSVGRTFHQFDAKHNNFEDSRVDGSATDEASFHNRPYQREHLKDVKDGQFQKSVLADGAESLDSIGYRSRVGDDDNVNNDVVSGDGDRDDELWASNDGDIDDDDEAGRLFLRLLSTATPKREQWENDGEEAERMRRAVTQALCPIKQGKHGEDEIAQLTKSTCTQTIAQSMCEEDEKMEVRRGEIRPLGESRSAAVYYGHDLCFSFFSRGAKKPDGCMSMCMVKDREYEVSLDVSGYTRTYWTLKFTGDCYFCGFSQPLTVVLCVLLSIVVIAATCCVCCRTDPSRQLSTMQEAMQKQMQKIVNSRNAAAEEAKNPPEEDAGEPDTGAETQGDITMDNDNLDATRDNENLDVTRDDDNLDATRDTRSRGSPTGVRPSPSMQSRSEAVTPSAPAADDSRLFDESKDWTDREC